MMRPQMWWTEMQKAIIFLHISSGSTCACTTCLAENMMHTIVPVKIPVPTVYRLVDERLVVPMVVM